MVADFATASRAPTTTWPIFCASRQARHRGRQQSVDDKWEAAAGEFHGMGFREMFAVSAHHGRGRQTCWTAWSRIFRKARRSPI